MKKSKYLVFVAFTLLWIPKLVLANSCDTAMDIWTKNLSHDMQFNYKDHSAEISQGRVLEILKKYSSNSETVLYDLDRLLASCTNRELVNVFRRMQTEYYTIVDLGRLAYAIVLAEKENNIDLFIGAVKGIYKKKYQHLAYPLLNRAAIEYRKNQIRQTKVAEEEAARAKVLKLYRSMFDSQSGRLKYKFRPY
ncbi:hypothetical protein GTH32_17760 [Alteromonas sp. 345S023]|uniref:Uncharacterized protein n=1 Tax=Alteromonas profundi TaxID=2696062 RepID=A0A7X5RMI3_9ALTE|nr:hypothetical protein [Alteromonas profundi]NDV93017.1 hypothetical protein [Alteromonas profundi]